jgi:hypothetical protein
MAILLPKLTTWLETNKDYLRVTEILAPLWDGGPPHMTIRIESSNWKKVKSAPVMEPTLTFVKEDEAQRVPAILSKSVIRRLHVQTTEKKARKTAQVADQAASRKGS